MASSGEQIVQIDQPVEVGITAAQKVTVVNSGVVRVLLGERDPSSITFPLLPGESYVHTDGTPIFALAEGPQQGLVEWIAEGGH